MNLRNRNSKNLLISLGLLTAVLLSGGCNIVGPLLFLAKEEETKKIPAEYNDLGGKKVCIWVWGDESLLFDYPAVKVDSASHAKYYIQQHVKNVDIVDPIRVDKFQRSNYEADTLPVVEVGRKFNADVVLFIQVSDFVTRPVGSPNMFQGRMNAQCALYDCKGELPVESSKRKLWSGKINVVYPDHPVGIMETNDLAMRSTLLKLFGESLAKKFYEYTIKLGDEKFGEKK
jgi:hypothetical protein